MTFFNVRLLRVRSPLISKSLLIFIPISTKMYQFLMFKKNIYDVFSKMAVIVQKKIPHYLSFFIYAKVYNIEVFIVLTFYK